MFLLKLVLMRVRAHWKALELQNGLQGVERMVKGSRVRWSGSEFTVVSSLTSPSATKKPNKLVPVAWKPLNCHMTDRVFSIYSFPTKRRVLFDHIHNPYTISFFLNDGEKLSKRILIVMLRVVNLSRHHDSLKSPSCRNNTLIWIIIASDSGFQLQSWVAFS